MRKITTDTLNQIIDLLPQNWSEPKINQLEDHAISATFAKENIILTILTHPDTNLTSASYLKIGELPSGVEEKDLDDLLKRINDFLVSIYRIEQLRAI